MDVSVYNKGGTVMFTGHPSLHVGSLYIWILSPIRTAIHHAGIIITEIVISMKTYFLIRMCFGVWLY